MACLLPVSIRDKKNGGTLAAPCGKCPDCRNRRAQSWVFRLTQEEKVHFTSAFITLTYSHETVPISQNGFMTLCKSDFQDFIKRLRFNTKCKTIKYYACGEYGSTTWRPHYHAIIFDVGFEDVFKAWGNGQIHFGDTRQESIAYTTKYMCKPSKIPLHSKDDRIPEFSLMSKGMGKNYLTDQMIKYHEQTQNSFVTLPGGYLQSLPRYYRDRIFTLAERERMNAIAQSKFFDILDKNILAAGGPDKYYHNRHEAIKAAMRKYNETQLNRNTI